MLAFLRGSLRDRKAVLLMLYDFFSYLLFLVGSWLGLIAGSLGAAVALYERAKKQELQPRRYVAILLAFLLIAGFLGWREERTQTLALTTKVAQLEGALNQEVQKHKPDIRLTPEAAIVGSVPDEPSSSTGIIFYVAVRNVGFMASIVDGYSLQLEVPPGAGTSARIVQAQNVATRTGFLLRTTTGTAVTMDKSNWLYEKTLKPVPSGGMEKGVLAFVVPNVSEDQIFHSRYRLASRDVTGKEITTIGAISSPDGPPQIPFVPGIEQKPLPRNK